MSVYRPKGSPFYHFDFRCRGHRFHGSTKRTNRREAESVERDRAKQSAAAGAAAITSLQLDHVTGRYWQEVGQHHAGSADTWRDLERLVDYFGPGRSLAEIADSDVAELVAWRRAQRAKNKRSLVTNTTVNRSTTEVLKKLFTRAKSAWGAKFDREPRWREHRLPEPVERVRELHGEEAQRLEDATRDDYTPFFDFALASGLRLNECLLKWSEVNWDTGLIQKRGKGGKTVSVPVTPTIRLILWPLQGHDPVHVFTYIAARTRGGRVRGVRYPLTYNGVKTTWRRLRAAAGVTDFRFHDFRHDVGTKLLRKTGNLKLVQRALNHSNITTTTRYAHVLTEEVAQGLEQISRKNSRKRDRKVS